MLACRGRRHVVEVEDEDAVLGARRIQPRVTVNGRELRGSLHGRPRVRAAQGLCPTRRRRRSRRPRQPLRSPPRMGQRPVSYRRDGIGSGAVRRPVGSVAASVPTVSLPAQVPPRAALAPPRSGSAPRRRGPPAGPRGPSRSRGSGRRCGTPRPPMRGRHSRARSSSRAMLSSGGKAPSACVAARSRSPALIAPPPRGARTRARARAGGRAPA